MNQTTDMWTQEVVDTAIAEAEAAAEAYTMREVNGIAIARQGDVLLLSVNKIPTNLKVSNLKNRIQLVRGEATGHTHTFVSRDATYFPVEGDDFVIGYLDNPTESVLVHEEHGPIITSTRYIQVRRQRQGAEYQDRVAD